MPGVNSTDTWLTEYSPYADGVLAAQQLRCAELSETAVDAAVAADKGSGCWSDPCSLMYSLDELARNLGMQSAEAFTYLVMLAGSFGGAYDSSTRNLAYMDFGRLWLRLAHAVMFACMLSSHAPVAVHMYPLQQQVGPYLRENECSAHGE